MASLLLSVAIITKNEEERLPGCLRSVSFTDDIVVVDSGSTDRTVEIARAFGCRVFVHEWKGEGLQRNFAAAQCRNEWVLILDADERVTEDARDEIMKALSSPGAADAYAIRRKNFFNGKWIRHSGWWPDKVVRLIRRDRCRIVNRNVHLEIEVDGRTEKIASPITHYPVRDIETILIKINRYSTLGAKDLQSKGTRSSPAKTLVHALSAFMKTYFLKLGFLDGKEGLIIAFSGAVNTFYKYVKLMDLNERKEE